VSTASAAVVTVSTEPEIAPEESGPIDDRTREEIKEQEDEDIYSIKNFSI
jgi:hypothetical protein